MISILITGFESIRIDEHSQTCSWSPFFIYPCPKWVESRYAHAPPASACKQSFFIFVFVRFQCETVFVSLTFCPLANLFYELSDRIKSAINYLCNFLHWMEMGLAEAFVIRCDSLECKMRNDISHIDARVRSKRDARLTAYLYWSVTR